jgi:hypothetical protein
MSVNFMDVWSILLPLRTFYGYLVNFVLFLVYLSRFGMLYKEKSGNPGRHAVRLVYNVTVVIESARLLRNSSTLQRRRPTKTRMRRRQQAF